MVIIVLLSTALVTSIIFNIVYINNNFRYHPKVDKTFIIGMREDPFDLDPVNSWDFTSNAIIEQVCEGLFKYNLSHPELQILPCLATDFGTWDSTVTHYTVPLRQGIFFHDGTKFNASVVQWNFERLNWFLNATGDLTNELAKCHTLWELPNGSLILDPINPVTIHSEYVVTINLAHSYSVLESLLCSVNSYLISPQFHSNSSYIPLYGDLKGTGPFEYDYYIADTEVRFHRFEDYWKEPSFFKYAIFKIIHDSTMRNNMMLNHEIDYLYGILVSLIEQFKTDPSITFVSGIPGFTYYYFGMNTKKVNRTWRQAISYAMNYTYFLYTAYSWKFPYRSNGPITPAFSGYNASIKAATYNLTKAREIILSMNLPGTADLIADNDITGPNSNNWRWADLVTWNYSYERWNLGSMAPIGLQYYLDQIGINLYDISAPPWPDYRPWPNNNISDWFKGEIFWNVWSPKNFDHFGTLAALFSNQSISDPNYYGTNIAQYHNHKVEIWLKQVLHEIDEAEREKIYSKILHQIVEVDMPHVFLFSPYISYVHSTDIHGVPYNAMVKLYIYPMYRV